MNSSSVRGFKVFLVDARAVARVNGRPKSDILTDCQWIQRLHSYGLLEKAFRPQPGGDPARDRAQAWSSKPSAEARGRGAGSARGLT